ncbi:hypothetical protein [Paucibacter sp. KCTC 42545]|uniref:hypothetical protein n=1 Tax=Paucibacter sp. KCTC 42545 TaxID=1768242 RepID=UPI000733A221|nr:hypothetical protein [Paucibacter sp. KCTC 42545]ALT77948.1 hypothetical protein AT984_12925 [Paucibacter sp. KCTC 42545]
MTLLTIKVTIPSRTSAQRDRMRRTMRRLGAVRFEPGTYMLPKIRNHQAVLASLAVDAAEEGGTATITYDKPGRYMLKSLFDRSEEANRLSHLVRDSYDDIRGKRSFDLSSLHDAAYFRAELRRLQKIDYYGSEAVQDAHEDVGRFEVEAKAMNYLYVAGVRRASRVEMR